MIKRQQIEYLVRQRDFSLTDVEVDHISDILLDEIINERYSFSRYTRENFTQQGKRG